MCPDPFLNCSGFMVAVKLKFELLFFCVLFQQLLLRPEIFAEPTRYLCVFVLRVKINLEIFLTFQNIKFYRNN